jgi:hypothetical protein
MKKKLLLILLLMPAMLLIAQEPADTLFIEYELYVNYNTSDSDCIAAVEVRWDIDSLYLRFTIWDDVPVLEGPPQDFPDRDFLEIYLDMDNAKIARLDINDTIDDYLLRYDPASSWEETPGGVVQNNEVEDVRTRLEMLTEESDTLGFIVDLAIPFVSLSVEFVPAVDVEIGFDVKVFDRDETDQFSWNGFHDDMWKRPYYWGVLRFAEEGKVIPIPDDQPPTTPINLQATVTGFDVKLTWEPSVDNTWLVGHTVSMDGVEIKDGIMGTNPSYTVKDVEPGTHEFSVVGVDLYGNVSDATTITVDVITSLEKDQTTQFAIYPNPANSRLSIQEAKNIISVDVISVTGAVVLSVPYQGTIDVSNLKEGLYLLRIRTSDTVHTTTFIKE